ncbi:hypothetical protein PDJAM_G00149940 [Pangasius djambal]|uniref:Uncharacterized protein n=1 Tax=Pangasius djambal TaxID=1691987 RepID=A0ACC5ZH03_9TELE|nr:hypothetical protein [Pangasius djambal]
MRIGVLGFLSSYFCTREARGKGIFNSRHPERQEVLRLHGDLLAARWGSWGSEAEDRMEKDGGVSDSESKPDSGAPDVPAPSDDTPEVLNKALSGLSSRWKNWWVRGILTLAMISFFFFIIYLGPMVLMMIVLCVQIKCFHEIITIGYSVYHSYDLPWFRTLSWYFLLCVNYFFYGETVTDYFFTLVQREEPLRILSKYHRFISFALYLSGFCMFVLSLVKKHYRLQFYMFGWTHVTLLIVVTQSHLIIHNLFEGMIWFIVPISCVICNDIMAYMFGFFFGRTPLIKLSPKKTWEGFIGGFFSTIVFGIMLSYVMAGYRYFVCPVEFNNDSNSFTVDCEPSELFQLQDYTLPSVLQSVTGWTTVKLYPFQIHSIALSSFASIMGPFGGFFASGFKRAFKIKDFANTIPGHGGIMDRFDCQYLMATFVNVYIASFIREGSGTVRLQGEEVKKVQEFKYLGTTVQSNGECGKEVKKRVQAGWNGWRKVSGVLCDRRISARIKGKVCETVVRAAMLYGLETVALRKRQEAELEVAELKMVRFSLGVTRLDRIRNEYIRGTAHVGRLGDKVREARLRWFGRVQRREREYIGRRMLDMELPGRR